MLTPRCTLLFLMPRRLFLVNGPELYRTSPPTAPPVGSRTRQAEVEHGIYDGPHSCKVLIKADIKNSSEGYAQRISVVDVFWMHSDTVGARCTLSPLLKIYIIVYIRLEVVVSFSS